MYIYKKFVLLGLGFTWKSNDVDTLMIIHDEIWKNEREIPNVSKRVFNKVLKYYSKLEKSLRKNEKLKQKKEKEKATKNDTN